MKKYELSTSWHNGFSQVQGSNYYETVEQLIEAYREVKVDSARVVKYIGLSLEYKNSLNYRIRQEIVESENKVIMEAFQDAGYDLFKTMSGVMFLK